MSDIALPFPRREALVQKERNDGSPKIMKPDRRGSWLPVARPEIVPIDGVPS